jgi:hypothetical protein
MFKNFLKKIFTPLLLVLVALRKKSDAELVIESNYRDNQKKYNMGLMILHKEIKES